MKQSKRKPAVVNKLRAPSALTATLFGSNPEATLPMLSMLGQAQWSIEELLGQLSRQFIERLLVLSAESVAGAKHPGRQAGAVRWHGSQRGMIALGQAKLPVQRPRLRGAAGEVAVPAYTALVREGALARRIADILVCNVSTRKYARVVRRCSEELGISKSTVSRQFVKQSAQALAELHSRRFDTVDLVAIYVDGIVVARHHLLAAIGGDASGAKHVLGLAAGSSENARVVKDLLNDLRERGVDLNVARLWVIDGAKALRSGIDQLCGTAARVQRCRLHKLRNVTERLPKDQAEQARWVMTQAFKLDADKGQQKLKTLAKQLQAQHPDAAASVLEGLAEMFTINQLGVTGELARCLATTNIIESPNSVVRRVTGRVTHYQDADMAMRWTAAGFIEAEHSFRKLRGYQQIKALMQALRPQDKHLKKAA